MELKRERLAAVFRAVVFELEESGAARAESNPNLLGEVKVRVHLRALRVRKLGVLVQRLPGSLAEPLWEPVFKLRRADAGALCRFHEEAAGGEAYCEKPASGPGGYCREHAASWKALYERCAQGDDEACAEAGGAAEGEFAVYALDYGGMRLKVGLTQLHRFLWRAAEQPHVSAAALASGGLLRMRELEKELGRRLGATEGAGARLDDRLQSSARALTLSPLEAAKRLANMLAGIGLEGSFEALQVKPRLLNPREFLAEHCPLNSLAGRRLRLLDYWAGILAFEDVDSGERLLLEKWQLLHRPVTVDLA
ncbi:MAG: hypothetical protein QW498_05005 [Thermofilum sp.]